MCEPKRSLPHPELHCTRLIGRETILIISSQILQYEKYTKLINIAKVSAKFHVNNGLTKG